MSTTTEIGEEFISHYGVKGMKWGERHDKRTETRGSRWDPEGHSVGKDAAAALLVGSIPVVGLLSVPAQVRLVRAAGRNIQSKREHTKETNFEKKANNHKNFVAVHNGAVQDLNSGLARVNKKYDKVDLTAAG